MVSNEYMTGRPSPPSEMKRFVDQQVFPAAINGAAAIERSAQLLSERTRSQPLGFCVGAMAIGFIWGMSIAGHRRRRNRHRAA